MLIEITDATQHKRVTRDTALLTQIGGSRAMTRQLAHEIQNPLGGLRGDCATSRQAVGRCFNA
jgi:two-component system nitrogen regulation sensor histidine kinase GlnL